MKKFFSAEIQRKLEEIGKRNLIELPSEAVAFCIDTVWFEQIGQYQEKEGKDDDK